MKTLLLDDNLMSSMRVEAGLRAAGCEVTTRRNLPDDGEFALVVVNLGSRSLRPLELLPPVKERFPNAKLWGFCGHLEIEIRRAALQSGIDRLLTNEVAMTQIGDEVRRHLP